MPGCKAGPDNSTFHVAVTYDPNYEESLLLACPIMLKGKTLSHLYHDRWPIEQLPLMAKQMSEPTVNSFSRHKAANVYLNYRS